MRPFHNASGRHLFYMEVESCIRATHFLVHSSCNTAIMSNEQWTWTCPSHVYMYIVEADINWPSPEGLILWLVSRGYQLMVAECPHMHLPVCSLCVTTIWWLADILHSPQLCFHLPRRGETVGIAVHLFVCRFFSGSFCPSICPSTSSSLAGFPRSCPQVYRRGVCNDLPSLC